MQPLRTNVKLTTDDSFVLYYNIFFRELRAIISARDYKSRFANLSRKDRNKIKKNYKKIAEIGAKYFINNNGSSLIDESAVRRLFEESISKALEILS